MMEILGYASAILIGLSLGLIGGGGSILTVPLLVYLFNLPPVMATSYSLFIVGITSLLGAYNYASRRQVNTRAALLFGASSVVTVFIIRRLIIPGIPEKLFSLGKYEVSFSFLTMLVFALLMVAASIPMIRGRVNAEPPARAHWAALLIYGVGIGLVTGFLGAGGGFLLVPALVLLIGLDMKTAVGTSLLIITLNSLIGFTGDLGLYQFNWKMLIALSLLAMIGLLIGSRLGDKMDGSRLKKGFGYFILGMALFIMVREFVVFPWR